MEIKGVQHTNDPEISDYLTTRMTITNFCLVGLLIRSGHTNQFSVPRGTLRDHKVFPFHLGMGFEMIMMTMGDIPSGNSHGISKAHTYGKELLSFRKVHKILDFG